MSEKLVIVGVMPDVVVLDPGEQAVWISNAGNIKVEFDPQRCPFSSNVLQAPAGVRLISGPTRSGQNPGSYKYKLRLTMWLWRKVKCCFARNNPGAPDTFQFSRNSQTIWRFGGSSRPPRLVARQGG